MTKFYWALLLLAPVLHPKMMQDFLKSANAVHWSLLNFTQTRVSWQ